MKIVFITSGTVTGSISYRSVAFAKELAKKGHKVFIIAPKFDKYSKFLDEGIKNIGNIKIVRPLQPKFLPFELSLIPYIFSSLILLIKINPDIVHIYKANPITLYGLLLKYFRGKKVIFDTDDLDSEVMKIERNPELKIKLVQLSEYLLSKYSDAIITGSEYLKKHYHRKFAKKVIAHIPNGAEFRNRIQTKNSTIVQNRIIFIGNINRSSILKPLFDSTKKLMKYQIDFQVTIIGNGNYLNYFKNLAKKLAISQRVRFLGFIPQKNLHKYVKYGDIGYSYMPNTPTQKACSNMKVFQYMQYGGTAVVSNVGDLPLYTFNGKAGYIAQHGNGNSLTHVLKDALLNKDVRIQKINYAVDNAKKEYSWSVLSKKVLYLYQQL